MYNAFGEVKSATDGDGAVTTFEHDALGRDPPNSHSGDIRLSGARTRISRTHGSNLAQDTTFDYDAGINAIGKLSSTTSVEGIIRSFEYDRFGRLHEEDLRDETGASWPLIYDYDARGRLSTVTYPPSGVQPFRIQYDYADGP